MDERIRQRMSNTIRFMKLAAVQLRRIAAHEPELSDELCRFADQVEKDADEVNTITGRAPRSTDTPALEIEAETHFSTTAWKTARDAEVRNIMDDMLLRAVDNTIRFLRMAAIQLRNIAERETELANELRRIAAKLDDDADELEAQARRTRGS